MKGDNHAIQQDQDMVNEIDDDLALMKKLRKDDAGKKTEEDDEDGTPSKKEKSKGNFFLSDRGNQIRDNLER